MNRTEICRLIQKLIALAGNNPNAHEREQALEKAHELLAKHHLTEQDVQLEADEVTLEVRVTDLSITVWERQISQAVAELHYCQLLAHKPPNAPPKTPWRVAMLGRSVNIDVAVSMARWLIKTIKREAKRTYSSSDDVRSFCYGASYMIMLKVARMMKGESTSTNGTALMVLRNRQQQELDEFRKQATGIGKYESGKRAPVNKQSFNAGIEYADKLHLGKQLEAKA